MAKDSVHKRPDREVPTVVHYPKTINVRLKKVYKQYLIELCEYNHKTQSDLVREILEKSLFFRHKNMLELKSKTKKAAEEKQPPLPFSEEL